MARNAEVDTRPLGWGRIALGSLLLLRTTPLLRPFGFDFTQDTFPLLGWPGGGWQGTAVGVELPSWLLASACIVRTLAALCFLLGLWTRVAGLVVGVSGYLVLIQNPFGFVATLDLLYQGSIVLALADSGASLALRPEPARNPASSLLLIRVFLGSIYFWAAFVKLRPDWLDGRTLELFLHDGALRGYVAELLLGGPLRRTFAAWMIALTELSLPVLLLWPRTRRISVFIALGLHGLIELCAQPDLLGFGMGALLLCLLPPPEAPSRFSHKRPRSRARQ